MLEIGLTEQQVKLISTIAYLRNKDKKSQRGGTSYYAHQTGVFGELAVSIFLDGKMDWEFYGDKGQAGNSDGVLPTGEKCEVKTVTGINKDCIIRHRDISSFSKMGKEDILILVWKVNNYTGYIVGYLPIALINEVLEEKDELHYGQQYIKYENFLPIEDLVKKINIFKLSRNNYLSN